MAKSGYIVTKSNYTLKKFHKNTSKGTIYERDFMATNNLGGWDSGSIPNSENSFKMVYRDETNSSREHHYGEYLATENGSQEWTLKNGASSVLSSESHIVLNPDNTTLLSYAYYGSCTQLIQSSIRKIINNFPAEIWSNNEKIEGVSPWHENKFILHNEFDIDAVTKKLDGDIESQVNPLRYLYLSYNRYFLFINGASQGCLTRFEVSPTVGTTACYADKEITLYTGKTSVKIWRCWINKEPVYLTAESNMQLRLGDSDIEAFFNNLEDFQKLLLNRNTTPIYTAKLDFPHETERGVETYAKTFTWPTTNGWNLDIISKKYEEYVKSLLTLAEFYDEYNTDNLWKNMTHESIKNMDITFTRKGSDEDIDDYNEGTSKIQGLLWAYGRQFDEIKRYTDNIKSTNVITYRQDGNIPDYFLTDSLNLSGWEVSSAVNGLITGDTANKANVAFLKNLKINSSNILSRKGTRQGIEEILGLFGYFSDDMKGDGQGDYSMIEKVKIATATGEITHAKAEETLSAEKYNEYKSTMETDTPEGEDYDTLKGLPVILYYYYDNKELKKTIIPWFKDVKELDGSPYFQMYGGWEKIADKYTETISYLNIIKDCNELSHVSKSKLPKKEGNIVYVYNIDGCTNNPNGTHYFKQKGNTLEWIPIEKNSGEVKELTSIIEEYRGNNPHTGYGNYDNGEEYLKYYEQIFHYAIDNDLFNDIAYDCQTGKIIDDILEEGFSLDTKTDNKKCHYFYDKERENPSNALILRKLELDSTKISYTDSKMNYVIGDTYGVDVTNRGNDENTIHAEPSIINVKNFKITFRLKGEYGEQKYIEESILPYLTQMIPSTTILEINYE